MRLSLPLGPRTRARRTLCYVSLFLISACATTAPPQSPATSRIPALEAAATRNRNDLNTQVQLGAAYLQAGRHQQSAQTLEAVIARPQHPASAAYFLGLAYEGLNRAPDARKQYSAYLQGGTSEPTKRTVRGRLAALDRLELENAVRAALTKERELTGPNSPAPAPRVVGVFPFFNGAGGSLGPLSRALAELLTNDLSQSSRITVVERAQVQRLLDEIRLGQTQVVDPQTAVRAGRLLAAGRIVQGRLDGVEAALSVEAMVVPVPQGTRSAPLRQQGALREILTMQNNMALGVYRSLGVELTVAERERVMRQPTQNVQALLAFGLGLEAEDAGQYAQAAAHYRRAVALDPNFQEASTGATRSEAKLDAADDTPDRLTRDGLVELLPNVAPSPIAPVSIRSRFDGVETMIPNPSTRDPVAEVLGTETISRRALVDIVIRRPQ